MKKLCVILCFLLLLVGCTKTIDLNTSTDSSANSSNSLSSFSTMPEFNILGKYVCFSDYHKDKNIIKNPDDIPSITFYENGKCNLFVAYFGGVWDVNGLYEIKEDTIKVELDLHGTPFEGIDTAGNPYMDAIYIFNIIDNDKLIIDKGFYSVYAGDPFISYQSWKLWVENNTGEASISG